MKKVKGKALSLVLSLALVISSFSLIPVSAASHSVTGTLSLTDGKDAIYLVNGGTTAQQEVAHFGTYVGTDPKVETDRHEMVDAKITSISHSDGDRLVKWDTIDDDTTDDEVAITLKNDSVSGHETLKILYEGTTEDEDENEITVKAVKTFDIYVYDKNATVIGDAGSAPADGDSAELDSTFAQKTLANLIAGSGSQDHKALTVYEATNSDDARVHWATLNTVVRDDSSEDLLDDPEEGNTVAYLLKSSSDNVKLANTGAAGAEDATLTGTQTQNTGKIGVAYDAENAKLTVTAPTDFGAGDKIYYSTESAAKAEATDGTELTSITAATVTNTQEIPLSASQTYYFAYYKSDAANMTDVMNATDAVTSVFTAATEANGGTTPVVATVKEKASTGSVTFTAEPTAYAKSLDGDAALASSKAVTVKSKVDKTVKVSDATAENAYTKFGKLSGKTYLYSTALSKDAVDNKTAFDVTGYEVNFDNGATAVAVDDKASVTKISGTVKSVDVGDASVSTIDVDTTPAGAEDSTVTIGDSKIGTITADSTNANPAIVEVSSQKASVGDIDADRVDVTAGKTGNITATDVNVSANEDDATTDVGDISAQNVVIDSKDSAVTAGTITSTDADGEIDLTGSDVTVKGFNFDYYNTNLKFEDFQGSVPAPTKADEDGATVATTDPDDRVTVTGNATIDSIGIEDESILTFDGSVDATSVDGSGTLVIGAGKLYVDGSVTGPYLKLSDPTLTTGETVFTALSDTVNADDFTPYGFTLSKDAGSSKDTFKIDSLEFAGLTINKTSTKIAKGLTETFTASAYAPGSKIPDGYTVEWNLDADDSILSGKTNDDGSFTVTCNDVDPDFASENKGVLTAYLVDENNDVADEYTVGECDVTAIAVPEKAYSSDTGSTLSIGGGFTYQFAVTSLVDGKVPTFGVGGSSFKTSFVGNSGNTYYYKVTAVGKIGDAAGVYINGEAAPSTVITITNPSDTSAVTVKAGGSYQFRVNGPSQPVFQVAGIGNIPLTSKDGSNYYFKVNVPTNLAKGGHGVYNNGVVVAILTVA